MIYGIIDLNTDKVRRFPINELPDEYPRTADVLTFSASRKIMANC